MDSGNNGGRRERELNPIRGGRQEFSIEDIIEEVKRFFKGGGGGGGGGREGLPPHSKKLLFLGFIGLLILIAVFTSFYTIGLNEEGVVTRFGRYNFTTSPGLHFKLPFGIDRVTKVPSKVVLQEEFGFQSTGQRGERTSYAKQAYIEESLMLTGDLNVADVEWILQYRISDPWKFLFHARNVRKNIRDVTMSIMRRVVGDRLVGEVLTIGRVEIADQAKILIQEVLDKYDMGITLVAIILQDVNPPESVKQAFNEVNAAKQEQEQAINIADREYNKVIPEARGKAQQQIAKAQGFAVSLVNRSKGDANKFNSMIKEYRKSPDVTRRRLYIETMEKIYANQEKLIIVDSKVRGVLPLFTQGSQGLMGSSQETKKEEK